MLGCQDKKGAGLLHLNTHACSSITWRMIPLNVSHRSFGKKKKRREKPISSIPLKPVLISRRCEGPRPLSSRVTQTCFCFSQVAAGRPQQENKTERGRERRSRQVAEESACSPTPSRGKALMMRSLTWVSSLTTTRPLLLGKSSVRPLQVQPEY